MSRAAPAPPLLTSGGDDRLRRTMVGGGCAACGAGDAGRRGARQNDDEPDLTLRARAAATIRGTAAPPRAVVARPSRGRRARRRRALGLLPRSPGARDAGVVRFRTAAVAGRRLRAAPDATGETEVSPAAFDFGVTYDELSRRRPHPPALHGARRAGAAALVRARRHRVSLRPLPPLSAPAAAHHHLRQGAGAPRPLPEHRPVHRGVALRDGAARDRGRAGADARHRAGDAGSVAVGGPALVRAAARRARRRDAARAVGRGDALRRDPSRRRRWKGT